MRVLPYTQPYNTLKQLFIDIIGQQLISRLLSNDKLLRIVVANQLLHNKSAIAENATTSTHFTTFNDYFEHHISD